MSSCGAGGLVNKNPLTNGLVLSRRPASLRQRRTDERLRRATEPAACGPRPADAGVSASAGRTARMRSWEEAVGRIQRNLALITPDGSNRELTDKIAADVDKLLKDLRHLDELMDRSSKELFPVLDALEKATNTLRTAALRIS